MYIKINVCVRKGEGEGGVREGKREDRDRKTRQGQSTKRRKAIQNKIALTQVHGCV